MTDAPQAILVVDDQPAQAKLLVQLLEALGHTAVAAHSANEAWNQLERPDKFAVVLADIRMPDVSGTDFRLALRYRFPMLPVVLVTAFAIADDEIAAATTVLRKPLSAEALIPVLAPYFPA